MNHDHALLNALSEGVCLLDQGGNITFCNQRLETWLKQSTESMQGKSLAELFPRFAMPHIQARLKMVNQSQAPLIFSPQIHGYLFPCPLDDGEYRLQQTTVSCLQDGCLLLSVQDFTDQIRRSKAQKINNRRLHNELTQRYKLEKENKQLVSAMNQAAEAIMICNEQAHFQYVNHAFTQQTGWSVEEALQKGVYAQLRPDALDGFEHLILETVRSGKKWQGQHHVQRKDGSTFIANLSIAPMVNDDGDVTHAIAIQEDITQHILLETQYRRTQKQEALTTLVGGIAHDFNNLLSGMLGHIYLASREVKELPKTLGRLKKIQTSAYDAADIVKQLMTFSRRDQIDVRRFPLQSFLKEMMKLIERSVPENIEFTLDFEPYSFPMHGDPDLLQQSLMNMVQNSVDACASVKKPHIHIALRMLDVSQHAGLILHYPTLQYGEYADLSIADNGVGIASDDCERIFDPFFTTKQLGSGLGLATVMGCVRHHHGVIDMQSKLGHGTTFHLYLPICAGSESDLSEPVNQVQEVRILLADDDALVRETSAEFLRAFGHQVVTAFDGQNAIEIFEKDGQNIDVVIMDMVMPRINGPAAVRHIRSLNADVPVIFATAYDRTVSLEDASKFERTMLVTKPFTPEKLNQLLATVLDENWQGEL